MVDYAGEREWFGKIRALKMVLCPGCDQPIESTDIEERMRCPECLSPLCIGLSATNARIRIWLVVTVFGLVIAVGFAAFICVFSFLDLGSRVIYEFMPVWLLGSLALVGLILVLKFNRRLERVASKVRSILVAGAILIPILTIASLSILIMLR